MKKRSLKDRDGPPVSALHGASCASCRRWPLTHAPFPTTHGKLSASPPQTAVGRLAQVWRGVQALSASALPALSYLSDYAFFLGSGALLLALPIIVEIQRETTVLVMQKQQELSQAQMQEQAKQQNASVVDQVRGLGSLLVSSTTAPSQ